MSDTKKPKSFRIHHLQHVPFEGLGSMEPYLRNRGHRLTDTHLYLGQELPSPDDIDWLIVMGGPMGVGDVAGIPWLSDEKRFIQAVLDSDKVVIGICLGAQLIAEALGAQVFRNEHREIGWHPVRRANEATGTVLGSVFPDSLDVFHWHGDTFDIPEGGRLLASSKACKNQGFVIDDRVLGLQFHLETTPDSARALIDNCRNELDESRYVQTETEMLAVSDRFERINRVMQTMLKVMENR